MKKLGIILYDISVRGGAEQVAVSLANALAGLCEVHVITLCRSHGEPVYALSPEVRTAGPLVEEKRLRYMRRELKKPLSAYINSNKLDTVLLEGNYCSFAAGGALPRIKAQSLFCDHGALMNQWDRKDIVLIRFLAALLCDRVVTLTEESRRAYIRKFCLREKKVSSIYNWIDPKVCVSEAYDVHSKKIVSAGRFGREKGFDMLIKAFAGVAEKHPDWHLDIYGDGEMRSEIETEISAGKLENSVTLCGMVDDMPQRYKDYAMYVLPSYREGMPLVLLEAKANRLPMVSFDIMTGPREIIRDGVDGLLVEPYDLIKLADAMNELIENAERRQSMSDATQNDLERFSKEAILKEWLSVI